MPETTSVPMKELFCKHCKEITKTTEDDLPKYIDLLTERLFTSEISIWTFFCPKCNKPTELSWEEMGKFLGVEEIKVEDDA
jgi:hypothetical protein